MKSWLAAVALSAMVVAPVARAASQVYPINATGAQEVGGGDSDGTAIGTLTLDNGTGSGSTGSAIVNIALANIDLTSLSGNHIHQAAAGVNGGIVLDFGDPDNIRTGSQLSGTITSLSAATITSVFANPSGFYYNIHNTPFPGGAVRSQLTPEPGIATIVLIGGLGLMRRRRRAV